MEALPASPYLLLNGLGFIIALFLVDQRLQDRLPHRRDAAYVLLVLSVAVGWFGAHVLAWLVSSHPFSRAGFVFYGGLVAALAFLAAAGLKVMRPEELSETVNAAVVPVLIAHGFGRLGCFFAGCCYGVPIPGTEIRHPTQIYESVFLFLLALALDQRSSRRAQGDAVVYLVAYPVFRFFTEFLRGDPRGEAFGLSTSQWISLGLAAGAGFLIMQGYPRTKQLGKCPVKQTEKP
jgi:phosphatidylglycerol:prolipoprotein diacylglycerol transferase